MVDGRWIVRLGSVFAFAFVGVHGVGAGSGDRIPPTFAGLKSATTCIPGPIGDDRTGSYHLVWAAAKDNVTPSGRIVYNIFRASVSGRENFSAPTYRTRRGATTFATPPLPSSETYYFVVRARDAAGNVDRNRRERLGVNVCV
jgi:hypothetical protein